MALYYGAQAMPPELRSFDLVVVEPDHADAAAPAALPDTQVFAYVSVAEVQSSRAYYKDIPDAWKMARNGDWNSDVIDQTPPDWPEFFARLVIGPL